MQCRSRALLLALALFVFLGVSCGSESRRCIEPEPSRPGIAYIFRDVMGVPGSDMYIYSYWYFECRSSGCSYLGHWTEGQAEPPTWLATVREAQVCYNGWNWGCGDTLGPQCNDPDCTPRENQEAEEASIWLAGGMVAPPELYDRIRQDLAFIRASYGDSIPELRDIHFTPYLHSNVINLELMSEAVARFNNGEFHDLDSLNAHFKVSQIRVDKASSMLTFFFDGRYDTIQLSKIYWDTPSVLWAESVPAGGGHPYGGPMTVIPWPTD